MTEPLQTAMSERFGQPAAPGLAAGPLFLLDAIAKSQRPPSGSPAVERAVLEDGIGAHAARLAVLASGLSGDAADIIAFQIEMLADPVLVGPAYDAIAQGSSATVAWSIVMDAEIAGYDREADEYFRARAGDLRDIRDGVLRQLAGESEAASPPAGAILLGRDLSPSGFLARDWRAGGGVILTAGSPSSHVALLARSLGVPMVVGVGEVAIGEHRMAMVDGESGRAVFSPRPADLAELDARRVKRMHDERAEREALAQPALTADGVPIKVMVNLASMAELAMLDPQNCDGVGLVRTEFLFDGPVLPDEEEQYRAYRAIAEWAGPRPVTVRTFDIGGDKPMAGLPVAQEANPFLGVRGIRLLLRHKDVLRTQLRALVRAAQHGDIAVMLPMVTDPDEIVAARTVLDEAVSELRRAGAAFRRPALGIMVEVPAVAVLPDRFAASDFFSIGTNDLLQYVAASARDMAGSATLYKAAMPAVMHLIATTASAGLRLNKRVSLCGDLGSDTEHLRDLLRAGVRSVSVPPNRLSVVKQTIRQIAVGA